MRLRTYCFMLAAASLMAIGCGSSAPGGGKDAAVKVDGKPKGKEAGKIDAKHIGAEPAKTDAGKDAPKTHEAGKDGPKPAEAGKEGGGIDGTPLPTDAGLPCKPVSALYTFDDVNTMIFTGPPACTGCHTGGAGASGHLDLTMAPGNIINQVAGESAMVMPTPSKPIAYIAPGAPKSSYLYCKLNPMACAGATPPIAISGAQMPLTGPPYLTPAQLTVVKNWILEGAPLSGTGNCGLIDGGMGDGAPGEGTPVDGAVDGTPIDGTPVDQGVDIGVDATPPGFCTSLCQVAADCTAGQICVADTNGVQYCATPCSTTVGDDGGAFDDGGASAVCPATFTCMDAEDSQGNPSQVCAPMGGACTNPMVDGGPVVDGPAVITGCAPCAAGGVCGAGEQCIEDSIQFQFCAPTCTDSSTCPTGWSCQPNPNGPDDGGGSANVCAPIGGLCLTMNPG